MTTPRRRLVRPAQPPTNHRPQPDPQSQKLRSRLETERIALTRWMTRLKRAFHAVEKIQRRITRLEKQLARREEPR